MLLVELFDSGHSDFTWESDGNAQTAARFTVGKYKYEVEFTRKANKIDWEVKFALVTFFDAKKTELTKTGNEFQVFAQVVKVIKEFITNHEPKVLYFTAAKDMPTREGTYEKLLKYFSKELDSLGYVTKEVKGTIHKFVISKK